MLLHNNCTYCTSIEYYLHNNIKGRLAALNQIAIQQMRIFTSDSGMKRMEEKG